jgi:hypothetical protein
MKFKVENLTFGQAIELLKKRKLVSRKDWNEKCKFIFLRPTDELNVKTVVLSVKSLPQSVKDYFAQQTSHIRGNRLDSDSLITFTSYLCMKDEYGRIVNGWSPSQEDMFVNDWQEIDLND